MGCPKEGSLVPAIWELCPISSIFLQIWNYPRNNNSKVNMWKCKNAGQSRLRHIKDARTIEWWERERKPARGRPGHYSRQRQKTRQQEPLLCTGDRESGPKKDFPLRITSVYLLGLWRLSSPLKTKREDCIFCPVVKIGKTLLCNSAFPWHSLK